MLERVLELIEEDRLDEAIELIEKNPIVKVKESEIFKGDVYPWNDPVVLEDRIIFSTCWEKEGNSLKGAIYFLDKTISTPIKELRFDVCCSVVRYKVY